MSKASTIKKSIQSNEKPYEGRIGLVYARVSSKRQESEGSGLQSQEGRCINDLRSMGVPYEKSFLDSFSGGGDFMKRPAMCEMLAYIDSNPHKKFVVVFDDISRLARDVEFHFKLRIAFRSRDVVLKCLNYNFDESEEGEFTELIFAGKAQLDRKQNRRQVIQKMKARLDQGYWPFRAKRGYDLVKDSVHGKISIPNEEGLGVLKEALEMFATGNLPRKIDFCKFLVDHGFWENQRPEKYITKSTLILQDCFHAGDIAYPEWGVERRRGQHQGIISQETHELILKRLKRGGATTRIRKTVSDDFPLRGLVLCADCRKPLTGAMTKGKFPYYYCQHKECTLYGKMIRKDDVEKDFKALVIRNTLKSVADGFISLAYDRVWKQEAAYLTLQQDYVGEKQVDLEKKIRDLSEMARKTTSDFVRSAYEKQIEDAAKEVEKCEQEKLVDIDLSIPYRTAHEKATLMLKSPITVWESVNVYEKHRLFFVLFEERLPYSKKDSYWTADSLSAARLFEEVAVANTRDVDIW